MQNLPEVDALGELVCLRSGTSYSRMLSACPPGHSLLIVGAPDVPSYWDYSGCRWVAKPAQPSAHHEWDRASKTWRDPRTLGQIAAQRLVEVRRVRDAALQASDIEALRALDALLPEPLRLRRQALRDAPSAPDPVAAIAALTGETIANS